jgi:hypothetical protein
VNVLNQLWNRLKAFGPEVSKTLEHKAVQGASEMGGLWTGNAYRGDIGLVNSNRSEYQQPTQGRSMTP